MESKINPIWLTFLLCGLAFVMPEPVLATQAHSDPEGLYVHQFAHFFFIISLAMFIYWLRFRDLVKETGWRYIQYAALFLILWNTDAAIVYVAFPPTQFPVVAQHRIRRKAIIIESLGIEPIFLASIVRTVNDNGVFPKTRLFQCTYNPADSCIHVRKAGSV